MYLSNAEKEALWLTGYGDVPPWAVQQGLEQALARGSYVPGEEALRLRLVDALDLEERLATQRAEEAQGAEDEPTTVGQDAAEEAPTGQWRSPLEIVQEGAEEPQQEATGEEEAMPAAVDQQIEDRDFSSFSKTQLVTFAADQFGVKLNRWVSRDELIAQVQNLVDEGNGDVPE